MEEELNVDIVIYGSGLVSVLTASVLSSQGLKIILIDINADYGSNYRTLSLKNYCDFIFSPEKNNFTFDPFKGVEDSHDKISMLSDYHVDLSPKMLYSLSPAVTSLLAFGCDNYVQFTSVEASYVYKNGFFTKIPASKSGVFRSEYFTPLQKRCLSRFLESLEKAERLVIPEEPEADESPLFSLNDVIKYGICRYNDGDREINLLQRAKMYINSIGVYNRFSSPFIFPLYGTSDVVQAFARAASLLGCLFMLRSRIRHVDIDSGADKGKESNLILTVDTCGMFEDETRLKTTKINCGLLITESHLSDLSVNFGDLEVSNSNLPDFSNYRVIVPGFDNHVAVVISSEKLLEEGISTCILIDDAQSYLLQLDSSALTVPTGYYIYYIAGALECHEDVLECPHIVKFKSLFEKADKPLSTILFISHHNISENWRDSNLYSKGLNLTMVDEIYIVIQTINSVVSALKRVETATSQFNTILPDKDDLIGQNKFINELKISDSVVYKKQIILDSLSSLVDKYGSYAEDFNGA